MTQRTLLAPPGQEMRGPEGHKLNQLYKSIWQDYSVIAHQVVPTDKSEDVRAQANKSRLLDEMFFELKELAQHEQEAGDECDLQPTRYAVDALRALLSGSSESMRGAFPYGAISVMPDRGLRVEWRMGKRQVRLVVASEPQGRPYIYYEESADKHNIRRDVSAFSLAGFLDWMTNS